jgi:glycine/sarcosine N-methyltransferase
MANVELYDDTADIYDLLELSGQAQTPITNNLIIAQFRQNKVNDVLDMTCGTGAQTIGLSRAGFRVVGSDLSRGMLDVAVRKSAGLPISYHQADMRSVALGKFDAIISMFNAIGHLSTPDFEATIRNAADNLRPGGLYIFDIFNRAMMGLAPEHEIIDAVKEVGDTKFVRFTRSRFDEAGGKLTLTQRTYVQRGRESPRIIPDEYSLQTYRDKELEELLTRNGFETARVSGDGMLDVFGMRGLVHFAVARKAA